MKYHLSITIVTHLSSLDLFKKTINALTISVDEAIKANIIDSVKLYIVDNTLDTDYIRKLKVIINQQYPMYEQGDKTVRLVLLDKNKGYGQAHNQIIKILDSDYHLMLNPDVMLKKEAIANAINYMQNNPDVGMLSPDAVDENGDKLYLLKRYPPMLILFVRGFFPGISRTWFKTRSEYYEMRDINQNKEYKEVSIASGCFMFFRSNDIQKKFNFSENFFLYFEDFDLTWQFSNYTKIAYVPAVKIIHYGGDAAKKGIKHISLFVRSAITFYNRFGWKVI